VVIKLLWADGVKMEWDVKKNKELTQEEFNKYKHDDKFIHEVTFSHGVEGWGEYKNAMTKYTIAKQEYKVTKEFINKAKEIYQYRKNKILKNMKQNTLYFVGMGMEFEPSTINHIGNHRIRTYFKDNKGVLCFVEFGAGMEKKFLRCDHALYNTKKFNEEWGSLHERDETEKRISLLEKIRGDYNQYTKQTILKLINDNFKTNYNDVVVLEYFISTGDYTSFSEGVLK